MDKDKKDDILAGHSLKEGDRGYNNPHTPWGWMRNIAGLRRPSSVKLEIHGFFLIDRRTVPNIAIFKNCQVSTGKGTGPTAVRIEAPVPFGSLQEVMAYRNSMHLSFDDELKVKPVALVPDPGMENPQPNILMIEKDSAKKM